MDPFSAARQITQARAAGRTLDVTVSDSFALSLADAYAVQAEVTAVRLARGERIVGWKLGYTSEVMREQMGVAGPNFGPLTDAMLVADGATAPAGMQPRVEPEIGLRLGRELRGPTTADDALASCSSALACLEIVDSVWTGYRFTLEDNTADGSSASYVVVGAALPMDDLAALPVTFHVAGEQVDAATGASVGGHPAAGLAWLAGQLAPRGVALREGDLVITGGLTAARPLLPGVTIMAVFGGEVSVSVRGVDVHS